MKRPRSYCSSFSPVRTTGDVSMRALWTLGGPLVAGAAFVPQIGDFSNYVIEAELGLSTKLTDRVSFETVLGVSQVRKHDLHIREPCRHRIDQPRERTVQGRLRDKRRSGVQQHEPGGPWVGVARK